MISLGGLGTHIVDNCEFYLSGRNLMIVISISRPLTKKIVTLKFGTPALNRLDVVKSRHNWPTLDRVECYHRGDGVLLPEVIPERDVNHFGFHHRISLSAEDRNPE
jgi:hypothetical protein